MAESVVVVHVPPYQGEYELTIGEDLPTQIEWRWIKKISGHTPVTYADGFRAGDTDLFLAIAVISMRRAGKIDKDEVLVVAESFDDYVPLGEGAAYEIKFANDEGGEADPTDAASPNVEPPSSGDDSSESSEPSQASVSHLPTGRQDSDTGADSVQAISQT